MALLFWGLIFLVEEEKRRRSKSRRNERRKKRDYLDWVSLSERRKKELKIRGFLESWKLVE